MSDEQLLESMLGSEPVFQGRLLRVFRDRVRLPDGSEAEREYIRHPGAAVIVAMTGEGRLLFERQFRYPVSQVMLELPAGKIDPGEPSLETAKRELREETGYASKHWTSLGTMHPCIGYSNERIDVFLAEEITLEGEACLDQGEFLECLFLSRDEARDKIDEGVLTDAKTITALYLADIFLDKRKAAGVASGEG